MVGAWSPKLVNSPPFGVFEGGCVRQEAECLGRLGLGFTVGVKVEGTGCLPCEGVTSCPSSKGVIHGVACKVVCQPCWCRTSST